MLSCWCVSVRACVCVSWGVSLLSRDMSSEGGSAARTMPTWISDKQICPIFNNAGTRPNLEDKQRLGTCQPLVWLREKVTAALSGKEQDTNYPPSSQNWRNYWSVFCRKASLLQRSRHLFSYLFIFRCNFDTHFFSFLFSGGYFLVLKEKKKIPFLTPLSACFASGCFRLFRRRLFPLLVLHYGGQMCLRRCVFPRRSLFTTALSQVFSCACVKEREQKKKKTQYKCKSASH